MIKVIKLYLQSNLKNQYIGRLHRLAPGDII